MNQPSKTAGTPVEHITAGAITPITIAVSPPTRVHHDEDGVVWADVPATAGMRGRRGRTRRGAGQSAQSRGGLAARQAITIVPFAYPVAKLGLLMPITVPVSVPRSAVVRPPDSRP